MNNCVLVYCVASSDTMIHVVFDCIYWADDRMGFMGILRREPNPEDAGEFVCTLQASFFSDK